MSKVKRAASNVPVPRDQEEANRFLQRIGETQRRRAEIQIELDESVAAMKVRFEKAARPFAEEEEVLVQGLQLWAEANRAALTRDGATKTVRMQAGEILWRVRPPSVRVTDAESVIAFLQASGLDRFVRTKNEVDKDALLREPAVAAAVPGVKVGSAGEQFVVEPVKLSLSKGARA
jgi:phage host-nuclease inhibitor protein Gam